jgi:hypothetical protein
MAAMARRGSRSAQARVRLVARAAAERAGNKVRQISAWWTGFGAGP